MEWLAYNDVKYTIISTLSEHLNFDLKTLINILTLFNYFYKGACKIIQIIHWLLKREI